MRGLVLVCGQDTPDLPDIEGLTAHGLPTRPGKSDVDPLLTAEDAGHLIVAGTDSDLAAVVLRLLRKEKLASTTLGFVPADPRSAMAEIWSLPTDPRRALRLAMTGDVDPVPLIRDDAGGVLVGRGVIGSVRGVAYCDDQVALRGAARGITVEPDNAGQGLAVQVTRGSLFKRRITYTCRAFQLGCLPMTPLADGVPYSRPMTRWTWYRHTEDLRLVRGLA